jgi:hypothetical protein
MDGLLAAAHFHARDPGERFAKDCRPALRADRPADAARILTPNVVRTSGGGVRRGRMGCHSTLPFATT